MIFYWPHVRKCGLAIRNSAQGIRNPLTAGISRPRSTDKTDNSNPLYLFLYNFALDNLNFFLFPLKARIIESRLYLES